MSLLSLRRASRLACVLVVVSTALVFAQEPGRGRGAGGPGGEGVTEFVDQCEEGHEHGEGDPELRSLHHDHERQEHEETRPDVHREAEDPQHGSR